MADDQFNTLMKECLSFTKQFITRPDDLQVVISNYSSGLFEHENVPAFTSADGKKIVFNQDWLQRSLPTHADDVRFFIFHELRHVHQKYQISRWKEHEKINEKEQIVSIWDEEFKSYKKNYGDEESQKVNLAQEVEVDANAYAISLLNTKYLGIDNWSFDYSLPKDAYEIADLRSQKYYESRPELKRFIDKRYRELTGKLRCERKPQRNDLCPCGSGIKFKYCCIGKGIYD